MAWEHLAIDRPHLVYIILGGFTSLFMLCSSVIKERMYIGEATVATVCGIVFGPYGANLINPRDWGNEDKITLEFSRIVLVVQCFAVGVELPRAYMEKHWRSVTLLLVPVMTFGWLITSLFIWALFGHKLNWLDSLVCAACVTATDPVLASSVVGKGKFAKRVPKHLRDLLSAESGCNDGMAFPFLYLGLYLVRYRPDANEVAFHWILVTILYECVFGALYGVLIGYFARRAIRFAHERDLIDRESFLVFYFVLALFCAGSGSILGLDDLLVGFAAGVGFSNDGWFTEKTEEAHVSNVIDLLINLAFFVYFGTIIPWDQYNAAIIGLSPWRLVVLALLVLFFRRIPIMALLKPAIPDIKTWRESLFAGHFGPIGVGAIFVAILARAELETDSTTPLADLPADPNFPHLNIIELIWPITTFLVIISIVVHGSSIAVFTLGKHINTLTITMSYTRGNSENGDWMDRLPRIQSRSKSSMSKNRFDSEDEEATLPDYPSAVLPKNFLRRQREADTPSPTFRRPFSRGRKHERGAGGPVDPSAIGPQYQKSDSHTSNEKSESDTLNAGSSDEPGGDQDAERERDGEPEEEVYQEGNDTIIEDEVGNVLEVRHSRQGETEAERRDRIEHDVARLMSEKDIRHGEAHTDADAPDEPGPHDEDEAPAGAASGWGWKSRGKLGRRSTATPGADKDKPSKKEVEQRRGPARAFRFGRTIIVEDEDGEVIKKYEIPAPERDRLDGKSGQSTSEALARMGKYIGLKGAGSSQDPGQGEAESASTRPGPPRRRSTRRMDKVDTDDDRIRFTIEGERRRMSKTDFIKQIQQMDPKSRAEIVEGSDVPEAVKREARSEIAHVVEQRQQRASEATPGVMASAQGQQSGSEALARIHKMGSKEDAPQGPQGLTFVDEQDRQIPFHPVSDALREYHQQSSSKTAAERRRQTAAPAQDDDSDDDGTMRQPPVRANREQQRREQQRRDDSDSEQETAAERRRREAALGVSKEDSDEDEDGDGDGSRPRAPPPAAESPRGIRFVDTPAPRGTDWPRIRFKQGN